MIRKNSPKKKAATATKKSKSSAFPSVKIGVVTSRFNEDITECLREGALSYLEEIGGFEVYDVSVPGAVEIPLATQALIQKGCKGVIALGAVIRGETSHYDYVCSSVTQGLTSLMLQHHVPIGFGILTTENLAQAQDRAGGKHGNKGEEAAEVTVEMIGLLKNL